METIKYSIQSHDTIFYCKVNNYMGNYTISVGGNKNYCFIVAIRKETPDEAYIDRVEYDEKCVKDGSLKGNGGIELLVSAGLYTIKYLFPNIKNIKFKDDSYIYCKKGSKEYKMSLAFDYILKYNETWYQKKFKATLPNDLIILFKNSLVNLDKPLDDFEFQVSRIPFLKEYETIYKESKTPRNFINTLRKLFKEEYCFKVGKWLQQYIQFIGINIFNDFWLIDIDNIDTPSKYTIESTKNEIRGGGKNKTYKKCNFSLVSGGDTYSIIGIGEQTL